VRPNSQGWVQSGPDLLRARFLGASLCVFLLEFHLNPPSQLNPTSRRPAHSSVRRGTLRPAQIRLCRAIPTGRPAQKIRLAGPPDPPAHFERPKTLITRLHGGQRDPLAPPGREYNRKQPLKRRLGRYFHTDPAGPPDARRGPPAQEPAGPVGDL
jgi:hypothetical protein